MVKHQKKFLPKQYITQYCNSVRKVQRNVLIMRNLSSEINKLQANQNTI